jgi:hypothetical protein
MDGNTGIWYKKLTKKEVSLINKNVVIFAFFLFIAFIFWYLNSLGKEIKSDFRYPVKYINAPKGKPISSDLPEKLSLELKGQGYLLLKRKITGNKTPLAVDLSKVTFKRIPDSKPVRYYILSAGLIQSFKKQMGSGFDVLSVKPDTIFFTFSTNDNVSDKKVR